MHFPPCPKTLRCDFRVLFNSWKISLNVFLTQHTFARIALENCQYLESFGVVVTLKDFRHGAVYPNLTSLDANTTRVQHEDEEALTNLFDHFPNMKSFYGIHGWDGVDRFVSERPVAMVTTNQGISLLSKRKIALRMKSLGGRWGVWGACFWPFNDGPN